MIFIASASIILPVSVTTISQTFPMPPKTPIKAQTTLRKTLGYHLKHVKP